MQLQREVVFELRLDVRPNLDGSDVGHVRRAIQKQDAVHQLFGVGHLGNGFLAVVFRQAQVAPVLAHFRVEKVLIDGGQLRLQHFVQKLQDLVVSAHRAILAGKLNVLQCRIIWHPEASTK